MGQLKPHRKTSLPGVLTEGEVHFVSTGGGTSYVQYVINNSGQAIPPATLAHSHAISDVTGLQAALDSKGTASGTTGTIAQFTGASALGNSPLTVSGSDVVASAKVRATTSYVIPAVGTANTAYISGNFDAFVPVGLFGTGVRPGYGFYAAGVLGTYLYAETGAELHLRTNTGQDYTMWNSGNSRSDAQNDSRYVQSTRTLTINGTTFDLSANRSWTVTASIGSGTNGFVTKWNGSVLADSSINDSDANYLNISKGINVKQSPSNWSVTLEGGSASNANLIFYNPTASAGSSYFAGSSTGISVNIIGAGSVAEFRSNLNFRVNYQLEALAAPGTAPFVVNSTTMSTNLNADMVDGLHASSFALASSLSGYVPTTRTITINGTTFDLSANRSWTISSGGLSGTANYYARFASGGVTAGDGFIYDNGTNRVFMNATLQVNPAAWPKFLLSGDATNTYIHFADATPTSLAWINGQATRLSFAVGGTEVFRMNYSTLDLTVQKAITIGGSAAVLNITSTTMVPNFNADMVDGVHASSLVQTSRTLTINGTTFDLSANRSWTVSGGVGGSGTNGFVTKWSGSNLTDSSIDDSNSSYIKINKDFRVNNDGSRYWVEFTSNTSASGLAFYNPGGSAQYGMYFMPDGNLLFQRGPNQLMRFTTSNYVEFLNGSSAPFLVNSSATVSNLSADMVDGYHASSFVQTSRTLTINGTTFDLSANRSWTISGGVNGTGSTNMFTKWSTSGDVTVAEMYEVSNTIYVGSMGNNRHLVVQGSLVPKQMTASERASYSPGYIGALVYQTDGTEGLWVAKNNGSGGVTWVYVG